ncbi:MAG: hypothetical protein JJU31_08660 [Wenzhouxiangella sp.]|nr:hypothetical protein [Wenzhouxiangella sp.]
MKRLLYLAYYLKRMDWPLLGRFMRHVRAEQALSYPRQVLAFVADSLRYNISILEYYQFHFYALAPAEKATWAGTGTMYEFQLRANPRSVRDVLEDKRRFHREFSDFVVHRMLDRADMAADAAAADRLLQDNERIVLKPARGNCGKQIRVIETDGLNADTLQALMDAEGYDLAEAYIEQHPDLTGLSPAGVNTVRVFTRIDEQGELRILGCRLRISINSVVDNLAAGNIAAPIDETTGKVCGPGVYGDITRSPESVHPVTGTLIVGFQVPHWDAVLDLVRRASLAHPENRSVGWDVVLTADGPGLIEGNHDWCKLVWQLPVNRGLKHLLAD